MSFFRKKTIVTQETLGEKLRKVRLGKNWTLEVASEKAKISQKYLLSLEKSKYDEIPGEIYTKNFIRVYSRTLGLNFQECLEHYKLERHIIEQKKHHNSLKEIGPIGLLHKLLLPKNIKISTVCVVVIVVLSYIILSVYNTIAPPTLTIYSPTDNIEIKNVTIAVNGKSSKEAIVQINNQIVILQEDGSFQEQVPLRFGLNLIVIKAKRKHGWINKITRHILVTSDNVAQK